MKLQKFKKHTQAITHCQGQGSAGIPGWSFLEKMLLLLVMLGWGGGRPFKGRWVVQHPVWGWCGG